MCLEATTYKEVFSDKERSEESMIMVLRGSKCLLARVKGTFCRSSCSALYPRYKAVSLIVDSLVIDSRR